MDAVCEFALSHEQTDNEITISVCGVLDFATIPSLINAVESVAKDNLSVFSIDCERVTFIDSETVKQFLLLQNQLTNTGKSLYLCNCSRQVTRVLCLLGLSNKFERAKANV